MTDNEYLLNNRVTDIVYTLEQLQNERAIYISMTEAEKVSYRIGLDIEPDADIEAYFENQAYSATDYGK